jgi:hypothetical protein
MARKFTRRFTPATQPLMEWLVLVGEECEMHILLMSLPCETTVRRRLCVDEAVPILIGRP